MENIHTYLPGGWGRDFNPHQFDKLSEALARHGIDGHEWQTIHKGLHIQDSTNPKLVAHRLKLWPICMEVAKTMAHPKEMFS